MTKTTTLAQYASVLNRIGQSLNCGSMNANEKECCQKAFMNMLAILKEADKDYIKEQLEEVTYIFLPDEHGNLKKSDEIIVSDKQSLKSRLKGLPNCIYCLHISPDTETTTYIDCMPFLKLPTSLRPIQLSEIFKEKMVSSRDDVKPNQQLERFKQVLHSETFLKVCQQLCGQETSNWERFKTALIRIKVVPLFIIQTALEYNDKVIGGTLKEQACFFEQFDERFVVYISYHNADFNTWLCKIRKTVGTVLYLCMDKTVSIDETECVVWAMGSEEQLREVYLKERLDEQHDVPESGYDVLHTTPGNYVPIEQHQFLIESLNIMEGEFAVLNIGNIGDISESEPSEIFIYVRIIRLVSIGSSGYDSQYHIDTGRDGENVVAAHCLYMLVRGSTKQIQIHKRKEIANIYKGKSKRDLIKEYLQIMCNEWRKNDEENWKQFMKHFLLFWDPGTNMVEDKDLCVEVTDFILSVALELEKGHVDQIDPEKSQLDFTRSWKQKTTHTPDSQFSDFYEHVRQQRARQRITNGTTNSPNVSTPCANPQPAEGKRWMRQAEADYKAASEMFHDAERVSAFNWICYMCHQVVYK